MKIELATASQADIPVLDRLLQLYEYDASENGGNEIDANGVFPTVDTGALWGPNDHVFLIQVDGRLAGFALVTRHQSYFGQDYTYLLSEFFVLRQYRRRGIGEHAAHTLFDRFPGRWELGTMHANTAGQAFWRRVLGHYTRDAYQEVAEGCERWQGPIWTLTAKPDRT